MNTQTSLPNTTQNPIPHENQALTKEQKESTRPTAGLGLEFEIGERQPLPPVRQRLLEQVRVEARLAVVCPIRFCFRLRFFRGFVSRLIILGEAPFKGSHA